MSDRKPENEFEFYAREKLILALRAMLARELSFFEGARVVFSLRHQVGGVSDSDADFNVFSTICSETDSVPSRDEWSRWNSEAMKKVESELEEIESWAASFSPEACRNLIVRFDGEI
ncbi:hypothetical protein ACPRNU_18760 [Chromobacterium vaccinii]|uniref:hypothetical protein n=1 Tax=Chromobacterium vaccinii TaxID=1108595 RepID=UPI003C7120AB